MGPKRSRARSSTDDFSDRLILSGSLFSRPSLFLGSNPPGSIPIQVQNHTPYLKRHTPRGKPSHFKLLPLTRVQIMTPAPSDATTMEKRISHSPPLQLVKQVNSGSSNPDIRARSHVVAPDDMNCSQQDKTQLSAMHGIDCWSDVKDRAICYNALQQDNRLAHPRLLDWT